MRVQILVVLVFSEESDVFELDLNGKMVCEYLLESLNKQQENDPTMSIAVWNHSVRLCEKYRNFAEFRLTELRNTILQGQGLLILDSRAWLSPAILSRIFSRAQSAKRGFRISESNNDIFASYRESMTLGVYLPPQAFHNNPFVSELLRVGSGLEQALHSEIIANTTKVTCRQLGAPYGALLITSYVDLAQFERFLLRGRTIDLMKRGIRIHDPNSFYLRGELICGAGVIFEPNVIIEGIVSLGDGVKVGANSILRNCQIGAETTINPFSLLEQSTVGSRSFIGPFGRIRPGCNIGDNVQIGNYVEIKNSRIGDGSRINHHTFIGDALLFGQVTIGAGTITCNHDGVRIHRTVIEEGAYIGSGCNLVAPLKVGKNAVVGAGSTITQNVPSEKLTIARQKQTTIDLRPLRKLKG